jgi:hypothetical protein
MRWWRKEDFELRREGRKKQEPGKAEIIYYDHLHV